VRRRSGLRRHALLIGLAVLAGHLFLPWPPSDLEQYGYTGQYRCTAGETLRGYFDLPEPFVPRDPVANPDSPSTWLEGFGRYAAFALPPTVALLAFALGLLAALGLRGRGVRGAGWLLPVGFVVAVLTLYIATARAPPIGDAPATWWERVMEGFGTATQSSFLLFLLPFVAGLVDLGERPAPHRDPGAAEEVP
jgi:hypothetical protein